MRFEQLEVSAFYKEEGVRAGLPLNNFTKMYIYMSFLYMYVLCGHVRPCVYLCGYAVLAF